MRIALYTLGCKLNQSETEAIASVLSDHGYSIVPLTENHDCTIVNTCTVTTKSEQKARRIIRAGIKKNKDGPVIITGCYAQVEPEECGDVADNVIVVPQDKKDKLLQFFKSSHGFDFAYLTPLEKKTSLLEFINTETSGPYNPFVFNSSHFQYHSRGFLKIQDGCDCFCAYCRVPLARGRSVSLEPEEVINRIISIENAGYGEVVLTGINISAYRYSGTTFADLLEKILSMNNTIRIRLSSLEPDAIDEGLGDLLSHPRICPHFHIPVQSGSNRVLGLMKRRYTAKQVLDAAGILQRAQPGSFLGADILTGFPGEEESDHSDTISLIRECGFSELHVFRYSPRPGTAAFSYADRVPEVIKKKRSNELITLSRELLEGYHALWKDREVEVLLEKKMDGPVDEMETYKGLSGNYLRLIVTNIPPHLAFHSNRVHCVILEPGNPGKGKYRQK